MPCASATVLRAVRYTRGSSSSAAAFRYFGGKFGVRAQLFDEPLAMRDGHFFDRGSPFHRLVYRCRGSTAFLMSASIYLHCYPRSATGRTGALRDNIAPTSSPSHQIGRQNRFSRLKVGSHHYRWEPHWARRRPAARRSQGSLRNVRESGTASGLALLPRHRRLRTEYMRRP